MTSFEIRTMKRQTMIPLPTSFEKVTWGRCSLRRSRDWLVEEQAVGGRAAVAGDARALPRGDRGGGGGVDSGGGIDTWASLGLTPTPLGGTLLNVSNWSIWPADLLQMQILDKL